MCKIHQKKLTILQQFQSKKLYRLQPQLFQLLALHLLQLLLPPLQQLLNKLSKQQINLFKKSNFKQLRISPRVKKLHLTQAMFLKSQIKLRSNKRSALITKTNNWMTAQLQVPNKMLTKLNKKQWKHSKKQKDQKILEMPLLVLLLMFHKRKIYLTNLLTKQQLLPLQLLKKNKKHKQSKVKQKKRQLFRRQRRKLKRKQKLQLKLSQLLAMSKVDQLN